MSRRTSALVSALVVVSLGPVTSRAADVQLVENPAYEMWSRFKIGSFVELNGEQQQDMGQGPVKMSHKLRSKLVELTPEKAVVEGTATWIIGGMEQPSSVKRHEIPARIEAEKSELALAIVDPRLLAGVKPELKKGQEEITVMGKAMKSDWYEVTFTQESRHGLQLTVTAKTWVNPEVPGGIVQNRTMAGAMDMLLVLTRYEAVKL
jgi:hypothetical protein